MLNVIQGLKQIRLDLYAHGNVCAAARAGEVQHLAACLIGAHWKRAESWRHATITFIHWPFFFPALWSLLCISMFETHTALCHSYSGLHITHMTHTHSPPLLIHCLHSQSSSLFGVTLSREVKEYPLAIAIVTRTWTLMRLSFLLEKKAKKPVSQMSTLS